MAMYHADHPDGNYRMANRVQVFDPPRVISWEPGQDSGDGSLRFGGWVWRYDLAPAGPSGTTVTLSYDWSAVPGFLRQHIGFPPVPSGSSGQLAGPPRRLGHRVTGPQARPAPDLPSGLARPARQALAAAGYVTVEQLTQTTEGDLARMHGIGPKAIAQLRDALRRSRAELRNPVAVGGTLGSVFQAASVTACS